MTGEKFGDLDPERKEAFQRQWLQAGLPDHPTMKELVGSRELVGPQNAMEVKGIHERLWLAVICRPLDFEPYGLRKREASDCSCGCKHFVPLDGALGSDWGVCANVLSHRCGLLTWEHMGCPFFEADSQ